MEIPKNDPMYIKSDGRLVIRIIQNVQQERIKGANEKCIIYINITMMNTMGGIKGSLFLYFVTSTKRFS